MSVDSSGKEWTVETLKTHLEAKISALDKQLSLSIGSVKENIQTAMVASERALTKAEIASEKRFEGVNEFRSALSDQTNTLLPRAEYDARHNALSDRVSALEKSGSNTLIQVISACAALAAIVTLVILVVSLRGGK